MCVNWTCLASNVSLYGKNLQQDEHDALGDMFSSLSWELPSVQEYRNDLVQPNVPLSASVPLSTCSTIAIPDALADPNSPVTDKQRVRVTKMVARFCPKV